MKYEMEVFPAPISLILTVNWSWSSCRNVFSALSVFCLKLRFLTVLLKHLRFLTYTLNRSSLFKEAFLRASTE